MTQQANSRSESPWDRSSDSKDLNSLITDNASQFFSSPPLSTSIHGRLSIGTAGYLTVPKSEENSPVVRYKRNTQNVSISTSNLLNDDQDSHLKSAASVPDFSSCSPNNSSYVEEFDPLVPQRADSLEELFKAFNQIAEEKLPPELPPRIKKSPSKNQPGPPLPPKPPNDVIERAFSTVEPPHLSVRPSSSDSLRSSLAPPLPRRKANSEVCQSTDENLAAPDVGVVCLQPIEKLRSCIDKVKFRTESYAFSQSNCVADGFVLSTGGNNLTSNKLESLIKVRFFINDDERSSKEPYLEYRNCKLKRTANDILEFWKSNFSDLGPGHYYVRFCGCQIYMQPDSVIGSHLIVRKLFALRRPLDVCIKKVDDDIRSGKAEKRRQRSETSDLYASEAVTWPLASHLEHLVQIIVEANLAVEGDQEVGRKNSVSNRNLMRFIQSAKLLSSFLNIHYSPLSDAYDLLENSSSTDYNKKRELVMSEALDFGKYLISSFQYLKYCKEVTKLPLTAASNLQNFGVKIFSISNIGSLAVREALTKIFIDVCMYYNGRVIFKSSFRDFWHNVRSKATIEINQTLTFSDPLDCGVVRICDLPRELVLSVSLCYISETTLAEVKLASVAYPVFDCNGIFNDAQVFLPFWVKPNLPHPDYTHLSSPTLNTASNTSPILHMEIVNPSKESLVFSITQVENGADHTLKRSIPESPLRSSRLKRIDRIFQYKHENMLLRNPEIPLPNDERGDMIRDDCELIWQYRRNLLTDECYGSNYLPDVLFSNIWSWNYAQTRHINELISLCCGQMDRFSAFVILLYRFSDSALRQFAVENLDFTNDELIVLVPVLCECLKYEIYIANPLIEFLLQKCAESLLFGISLFRNFILCTSLPQYKQMFEVYKASISDICPSNVVQGFEAQERLARELEKFYTELNVEKETIVLKAFLADLNESLFQNEQQEIVSFFPPGRTCRGFNVERCFLHAKSNAKPMHLYFVTKSDFELEVIYKYGDDLRQDQLMSLLMTFMNSWWLSDNLDLKFISYGVFPCTPNSGFIEVVPNAVTLCQLQTFAGGFTGALNLNCIYQWLRQKNPDATAFDIALDNFTLSTAAYCVATYILGVCDRHNDNVMILPSGHLFHIDYGRIFGHNQKFGPVNRDRTPFILTKDMFYAINRSNSDVSESYYEFVKTCCAAYNVVRRNADFVIAIVRHMIGGERPEISREIQFLVQRLQPQLSEDEATQMFTQKINESIDKSMITSLNFVIHALGQTGLSSAKNKRLFDFTLNRVTREDTAEILMVKVAGVQHRFDSDNERFHVYVCEVNTEGRETYFVFRRWSHFRQLMDLLAARFPDFFRDPKSRLILNFQQMFSKQSSRLSHRRTAIQQFLDFIFASSKSAVRNSDAIYTFFQSLPEDKSFTLNSEDIYLHTSPSMSSMQSVQTGGKIEMKISCDDRKTQVKVLIKRCVDLMTPNYSNDLQEDSLNSNVYVKLKLLPVDEKLYMKTDSFKKKTDIKNSSSPIFNQLFSFNVGGNTWENLYMEVSVCYYQFSTVNSSCVGKVNIPLMMLQENVLEDTFLLC